MTRTLQVELTSFWKRLTKGLLFESIISTIIVISLSWNGRTGLGLIIGSSMFMLFAIRQAYWVRYSLLAYTTNQDTITFKFQDFNTIRTHSLEMNDLNFDWIPLFVKSNHWKLKFKENENEIFYITNFGFWKFEILKEFYQQLYKDIQRKPITDERIILNWW